jgi:hypothetical protein
MPKIPKVKKITNPTGLNGEKKPGNRKGAASWTATEDGTLKHMKEIEKKSWKTISEEGFQGKRTAVACMNHYSSSVRVGEKRVNAAWTEEEKEKLRRCREKGESWKETAKSFEGRTWNAVRLHYVLHLDGKTRVYRTPESLVDDRKKKHGHGSTSTTTSSAGGSGVVNVTPNTISSSSSTSTATVHPTIPKKIYTLCHEKT